ncbi:MAG: SPOR domain-containing protein, partial [Wenzhouxiangella sp.]
VNDATWHRVRVGPFQSARDADGARRRLQENGYEAMVLSGG